MPRRFHSRRGTPPPGPPPGEAPPGYQAGPAPGQAPPHFYVRNPEKKKGMPGWLKVGLTAAGTAVVTLVVGDIYRRVRKPKAEQPEALPPAQPTQPVPVVLPMASPMMAGWGPQYGPQYGPPPPAPTAEPKALSPRERLELARLEEARRRAREEAELEDLAWEEAIG